MCGSPFLFELSSVSSVLLCHPSKKAHSWAVISETIDDYFLIVLWGNSFVSSTTVVLVDEALSLGEVGLFVAGDAYALG